MHKYELTVVISGKVEEEARTATIEKIKEQIARFGGTVTNVDDWGKRRLAYEVSASSICCMYDRNRGFIWDNSKI